MWTEAVVTLFIVKVLFPNLPGGTEENHVETQNTLSQRRDLNHRPPECDVRVLTTRSRHSMLRC